MNITALVCIDNERLIYVKIRYMRFYRVAYNIWKGVYVIMVIDYLIITINKLMLTNYSLDAANTDNL